MLYSCTAGENNEEQMALVKNSCEKRDECRIEASREFFGRSECTAAGDPNMSLWLVYSCDGGTDGTKIDYSKCNESLVSTTTTTTTTQVILATFGHLKLSLVILQHIKQSDTQVHQVDATIIYGGSYQ